MDKYISCAISGTCQGIQKSEVLRSHLHAWIWDDYSSSLQKDSALVAEDQKQQQAHQEQHRPDESIQYPEKVVLADYGFFVCHRCTPLEAVLSGDKAYWSCDYCLSGRVSVRVADLQPHSRQRAFIALGAGDEADCANVDILGLEFYSGITVESILPACP